MAEHQTHGGARTASDDGKSRMNTGGHVRKARGGAVNTGDDKSKVQVYNAQGSEAMKSAKDETPAFKRGGHKKRADGGKAEGEMEKPRLDRRPRRAAGGRAGGHNPYSSAAASKPEASDQGGKGYEGGSLKRS